MPIQTDIEFFEAVDDLRFFQKQVYDCELPTHAKAMGWASCFTATRLLFRRVRSLTVAPHVYSQVPYEVLMSCTDNASIQQIF